MPCERRLQSVCAFELVSRAFSIARCSSVPCGVVSAQGASPGPVNSGSLARSCHERGSPNRSSSAGAANNPRSIEKTRRMMVPAAGSGASSIANTMS